MARKNGTLRAPIDVTDLAPETIGFRLDDECRRVLGARAARLGVSAHELARQYVIEMLEAGEERAALREAVTRLHDQLTELREDVAVTAEVLLVSAGKVKEADAREWADENFR